MAVPTADQAAQRWAQGLGAASQKITEGVQAVTTAPGAAAARQSALWLQQVTASQQKWARNVAAVSLSSWQDAMITKGVPRIGQGAQAAVPKMTSVFQSLLPYIATGQSQIATMPKGGLSNSIARMTAWATYMNKYVKPAGT